MARRIYTAICIALGCLIAGSAPVSAATIAQQNFINSVFEDLLDRPAEASDVETYSSLLDSGGSDFDVAYAVDTSPEYYTDLLGAYYQTYLNRPMDSQGLAEFLPELEGGTDQEVQAALLGSNEYFNSAGDDNATFVNSVFQILLDRSASPQDAAPYLLELSDGVTRSQVVADILGSPEYETDELDGWFQSFLDRAPESGDLSTFLPELQSGATDETVIAQILGSPEFFNLAQVSPPQSTPEPNTFLPLVLGLGFMIALPLADAIR